MRKILFSFLSVYIRQKSGAMKTKAGLTHFSLPIKGKIFLNVYWYCTDYCSKANAPKSIDNSHTLFKPYALGVYFNVITPQHGSRTTRAWSSIICLLFAHLNMKNFSLCWPPFHTGVMQKYISQTTRQKSMHPKVLCSSTNLRNYQNPPSPTPSSFQDIFLVRAGTLILEAK
jgi:hypothetical protein